MNRYRIVLTRDGQRFGILDREQYEYCSLRDEDGEVHKLEWRTRPAAEAWLQRCYRTWQTWEGNGEGQPPKDWRPLSAKGATSPFTFRD
ncbi:hypothetical protein [Streptomyces sp. NRRL S-146]|uniref:hypothetical protein n=1 Tax=Streptomyces sp. NRRL S-146 TaxID=1463884 RepID=UPI0004CC1A97|nr:hypothetical protein [Streptomyces sp. NRRL S-146]